MCHIKSNSHPTRLETLEQRRLLSATLVDDAIVVAGTDTADTVIVSYDAEADAFVVNFNDEEAASFDAADVSSLVIDAGDGDDVVQIDSSVMLRTHVHGGAGNDSLEGGGGVDMLFGDDGDDTLTGGNGNDMLRGGAGSDHLNGLGGNDMLWGHGGNDSLWGGEGDDVLRGGQDDDLIRGEEGNDTLQGHQGDDDVLGGEGDDLIRGHGGKDRLFAGRGNDALDGGEDDDDLEAGIGENILLGGQGSDTYVGDKKASIFADFDTQRDWLAAMLTDARDGGVQRFRDESTGFFTTDHPAYDKLLAAFDKDVRDAHDVRGDYGRPDLSDRPGKGLGNVDLPGDDDTEDELTA